MVSVIEFLDGHCMPTMRALNGVISKSNNNGVSPSGKGEISLSLFGRNSSADQFIRISMTSIDTVIANHFEVFVWDMSHKAFGEF